MQSPIASGIFSIELRFDSKSYLPWSMRTLTCFFPAGAFGFGAEPFCWGVVDMVVNAKRGAKASDTKPRGDLRWENADFTRSMGQSV